MNTSVTMYEWKDIPWRKLEVQVFKLQKRIYQASSRGDVKGVRKLQRLLIKSRAAKLLCARKVTQDNRGKRTAGIDGVKSLTPKQRLALAKDLAIPNKATPIRRVWIPKPGKQEKRPLGIPIMRDRAAQALVKLALEPEWEAKFEAYSYGFRPGRSAHDAIKYIFLGICRKDKYVLDADIKKCFDKINHKMLLSKLGTFPVIRRAIKAWLKAGVMEGGKLFPTEEGTPQGGVISPLLANIALHGLEEHLVKSVPKQKMVNGTNTAWNLIFVRYADDFIIMHRDLDVVKNAQALAAEWLSKMGLELSPTKTKIVHTFMPHEEHEPGFDFLGFSIRQYPLGKRNRRTMKGGSRYGQTWSWDKQFKTIITPIKEAILRHKTKLSQIVDGLKTAPQSRLIRELNSVIQGWANYYCSVNSKEIFGDIDHWLWEKLMRWAKRRHPMKPMKWIVNKYWHGDEKNKWDFSDEETSLSQHRLTPIEIHVNVKDIRSPFDRDWIYWNTRIGKYLGTRPIVGKLLKTQKGKCVCCGLHFRLEDLIEVDHLDSNRNNKRTSNLQALHGHCHDQKHGS